MNELSPSERDEIVRDSIEDGRDRPGRKMLRRLILVCLVLAVIAGGSSTYAFLVVKGRADSGQNLAVQVQKLCSGPNPTRTAQGKALCRQADKVVEKSGAKGDTGAQGPQGAQGNTGRAPSSEEISQAVASYCSATGACAGRGPTTGQVAAAVSTYCTSRGQCTGPAGTGGKDGKDGGVGATGPAPSAADVRAAVDAFCADGKCKGDAGVDGKDGAAGQNGRGIASVTCTALAPGLSFTVTYDDGTSDQVDCS